MVHPKSYTEAQVVHCQLDLPAELWVQTPFNSYNLSYQVCYFSMRIMLLNGYEAFDRVVGEILVQD